MGFEVKQQLVGLEALVASLNELKQGVRNRILRKGLNKPAQLLLKQVKANTPKRTGLTRKSLGRKTVTYKSGVVVVIIGPRVGFRKEVVVNKTTGRVAIHDPTKIWHLIERGTSHSAAIAPARRAYDSTKSQLVELARQAITEGIQNEVKKAVAKGKTLLK